MGRKWKQWRILFSLTPESLWMVDYSHEITLAPWKKIYEKPSRVLKIRDITLPTNVHIVKSIFFLVLYGCESWTIKKAEHQRIDAFKLWCCQRLLRVSWTVSRSNLSILKKINSEYSLKEPKLKLKLQYFGHLMQRANSLEKILMLRKIEIRRRGWQRMRWFVDIINWMDMSSSILCEVVMEGEAWCAAVHGVTKSWRWLSDQTKNLQIYKLDLEKAEEWEVKLPPYTGS